MAEGCCDKTYDRCFRVKAITSEVKDSKLKKCLSTFELITIAIGDMIGVGIFVLTGALASTTAGSGVVISSLIAAIAAGLTATCFAEFGARAPNAGSTYTYTYVTMGEIWAFAIGWDLILERSLICATVARGWSGVLDALTGNAISNGTMQALGEMDSSVINKYPDFLSILVILLVVIVNIFGAKTFAATTTFMTILKLLCVLLVLGLGFYKADIRNWTDPARGGFMPYGFSGVLSASATAFIAYTGFEATTFASEEAINPAKQIPTAIAVSLSIVTVLTVGSAASLTLMVPYSEINPIAPFTVAFSDMGMFWAEYVVSIGSMLGMFTVVTAEFFCLTRVVFAMSRDGLLPRVFSNVNSKTQSPIWAILIFSIPIALIACLMNFGELVDLLAIGKIIGFAWVAISLLLQRFIPTPRSDPSALIPSDSDQANEQLALTGDINKSDNATNSDDMIYPSPKHWARNWPIIRNFSPIRVIGMCIFIMVIGTGLVSGLLRYASGAVKVAQWWAVLVLVIGITAMLSTLFILHCYQQTNRPKGYSVPLVPLLPSLATMVTVALLMQLHWMSWVRWLVWFAAGQIFYFAYFMRHSDLEDHSLGGASGSSYNTFSDKDTTTKEK